LKSKWLIPSSSAFIGGRISSLLRQRELIMSALSKNEAAEVAPADAPIRPIRLLPSFRERVWGRTDLSPYFPDQHPLQPVGEAWYTAEDNVTDLGPTLGELLAHHPSILGTGQDPRQPHLCPLLIKLLFTSSRLSVQVHPDDEYAAEHHHSLGKTEAWYVLDAAPPGEVGVGFRQPITAERLRSSALSGEIEELIGWRKVHPGDTIFVPAGTVHAIGAGLTICEIQQNSDITYRLYDYGRPRELHLEDGCRVSKLGPAGVDPAPVRLAAGRTQLVESEYFRIEHLNVTSPLRISASSPHYLLLMCIRGHAKIDGRPAEPGQTWLAPAHGEEFAIGGSGSEWILTYRAREPFDGIDVI
jgi:mannose-6-phosphate isomerase